MKKFCGPSLEIFKRVIKGKKLGKYSESLKSFALTLHFYSAKAYNFLRKSFHLALPHPRSITSWYRKIPADSGFTEPAFKALELKVTNLREKQDTRSTAALYLLNETKLRLLKFTQPLQLN